VYRFAVKNSVTAILCVATCTAALGAAAAVYKWTDEQGVTHYGEKPPPGRKAQELQIRTAPQSAPPAAAKGDGKDKPGRGWQEQEREYQQRRVERLEQEHKEQQQQARMRAEAKERCRVARYDLDLFEKRGRPVYRLDEKGERKYYEDKERDAIIARAKKEVAEFCRS
jgi:hypothetical protein